MRMVQYGPMVSLLLPLTIVACQTDYQSSQEQEVDQAATETMAKEEMATDAAATEAMAKEEMAADAVAMEEMAEPMEMAEAITTVPMTLPTIGTTWVFRVNADGNTFDRTFTYIGDDTVEGEEVGIISYSRAIDDPGFPCHGADAHLFSKADGSWVGCTKDGEFLAGTLPSNGWYEWPLEVGNAWTSNYRWIDAVVHPEWTGKTWAKREVVGMEEIAVPAGTFSTLKIKTTRTASADWGETCWYAPEIVGCAKFVGFRTGRSGYGRRDVSFELISVSLAE